MSGGYIFYKTLRNEHMKLRLKMMQKVVKNPSIK